MTRADLSACCRATPGATALALLRGDRSPRLTYDEICGAVGEFHPGATVTPALLHWLTGRAAAAAGGLTRAIV